MAGGTFNPNISKKRPGVYVNVKSGRNAGTSPALRGIVAMPLVGYDWGPKGKFLEISSVAPDASLSQLGRSVADDNKFMRRIKMALLSADTVQVYIPTGGTKATGSATITNGQLTITAMYEGTMGNNLKVVSVANPVGGFDVSVYNGTEEVELFEGVANAEDLIGKSAYVEFSGSGKLAAFASTSLSTGTDAADDNTGWTAFLDACEDLHFDCMCFPEDDEDLQEALLSKIKFIRENLGRKCQAVAPNFAADYEGIINLVNGVEYDGATVETAEATAFIAGITAAADYVTSNTYAVFPGATGIVGRKTNEEAEASIDAGEMFFSFDEDGNVIIEYDINSLTTFTADKSEEYRKNRVLRVYDSLANELRTTFRPGQYQNTPEDWEVMESLGRSILSSYEAAGAVTNVSLEDDFYVDQSRSVGEATYFIVAIQAMDSAEKLYFSVTTR